MMLSGRYVLAYLWIFVGAAIVILLVAFAPPVDTGKKVASDSSFVCAPYGDDKCPPSTTRRKLTQEQLDIVVKHHEDWLKLDKTGQGAHPDWWANLRNYDLQGLRLTNIKLNYADLSGAAMGPDSKGRATDLTNSDLGDAKMICTDLRHAELKDVGLKGSDLERAKLCSANLFETHLENAIISGANLTDAELWSSKMDGAYLDYADLSRTHFEIDPGSLPNTASLAFARNLSALKFEFSRASLSKVRDQLKGMGLREQEKEITAAIMRAEMLRPDKNTHPERLVHGNVERIFNNVLFDWTCGYGNNPGRALELLGISFLLFAVVYVGAQQMPGSRGGIWAVWDEHRILRDDGAEGTTRLTDGFPRSPLSATRPGRWSRNIGLNILGLALWFSLLSAFQIGWQAFNFGTWFSHMQPREYYLRATGWVRVAAGVQSVISVYFVALWILTYFGTPFE